MKKKIFILVLVAVLFITGCGKKKDEDTSNQAYKNTNGFISYEYNALFDKLEEKTLVDGITYKELTWNEENGTHLEIIVYNNTDKMYYLSATVQGYKNGAAIEDEKEYAWEAVNAHSAYTLSFVLYSADKYEIESLEAYENDDTKELEEDAYTFESYTIDNILEEMKIFFKFNGEGKNITSIRLIAFKDGKPVGTLDNFLNLTDANGNFVNGEVENKGDRSFAWFFDIGEENFDNFDSYVYFLSGYYE
ncbi:MAG: hypothetical protein IJ565_06770 [Bacilli bacterium]|nr:hypothetical protein [Bacilli bacterium]